MTGSKVKFARRRWLTAYAPLLIWIGVILFLSSDAGAMMKTSRFIRPLLEFLFPSASEETLMFYHGLIRKAAHLTEYGVLALLASRVFISCSRRSLSQYWYLAAMWLVAFVAVADEVNQSFLSSRTGTTSDVVLDVAGGLMMIVLLLIFRRFWPARNVLDGEPH